MDIGQGTKNFVVITDDTEEDNLRAELFWVSHRIKQLENKIDNALMDLNELMDFIDVWNKEKENRKKRGLRL